MRQQRGERRDRAGLDLAHNSLATMASTNKCLAQSNKSRHVSRPTKNTNGHRTSARAARSCGGRFVPAQWLIGFEFSAAGILGAACHAAFPQRGVFGMRTIAIASLFVLAGTAAQAEIVCSQHGGCWNTGGKIILVDPSYVRGQSYVSHRNGKPQVMRWNGAIAREQGLQNRR